MILKGSMCVNRTFTVGRKPSNLNIVAGQADSYFENAGAEKNDSTLLANSIYSHIIDP